MDWGIAGEGIEFGGGSLATFADLFEVFFWVGPGGGG